MNMLEVNSMKPKYRIRYGNTERYIEELHLTYEAMIERFDELKTSRMSKRWSSDIDVIDYINVENIKTRNSIRWASKDNMEFEGVI